MLIIVEGIDRVGKTTLCKKLEKIGFKYFKDNAGIGSVEDTSFSYGKIDTTLNMMEYAKAQNIDMVFDRLHLTEIVYGIVDRNKAPRYDTIEKINLRLDILGAKVVIMLPTDINRSSNEAGRDLSMHNEFFQVYGRNHSSVETIDYTLINPFIYNTVCKDRNEGHMFYFASPFFNPEQVEREERLKRHLREIGYSIYSPKESCFLSKDAANEDRRKVFNDNCTAIKNSAAVFAITDGKDMGTIWEAGYAASLGKPIFYFAETLGKNQFNLMLAQSGVKVFRSIEEVTEDTIYHAIVNKHEYVFEGEIE